MKVNYCCTINNNHTSIHTCDWLSAVNKKFIAYI